jgi:hypothetical protein
LLITPGFAFSGEPKVTAEDVEEATQKAVNVVMGWLRHESDPATTSLRVMAVVNAGVPADDPLVANAIKSALKGASSISEDYHGTYQTGIVGAMLGMLKDPQYKFEAGVIARKLQRLQEHTGGWGDNSRTQYALLGLKGAKDTLAEIDPLVFAAARQYLEDGQGRKGGWGYGICSPPGNTMTAAGISSYFIVTEDARRHCPVCGKPFGNARLEQGIEFLGKVVNISERRHTYFYYYLYALERIGALVGQKYIGGHDWFKEGAAILVKRQSIYGTWEGEEFATEFALLFLGKGGAPLAIQKLNYGSDWNSDPYDAKEITELAARQLKKPMSCQVVDQTASVEELSAAPILYLQGRESFEFPPEMRAKIKAFVDGGGFLVASACCGGAQGFDKSFRNELKAIFPDDSLQPLPLDHEVYSAPTPIPKPKSFPLEGIIRGCRTCVFYSPHDLCCAWSGCRGCLDKSAGPEKDARALGVNLIAYAVGFQGLKSKLPRASTKAEASAKPLAKRDSVLIGQIYHEGDWNPDPQSIANLASTLKQQSGMSGSISKRRVVLGSDELGDFPILYLTGHKRFQFAPSAVDALRTYLDRGGFLLSDPCCGKAEFDESFRKLCAELCPDAALKKIPLDHPVLHEPFDIKNVTYKPAATRLFPDIGEKPALEGIMDAEGRIKILYSRYNFGCELQGHSCVGCVGLAGSAAYKLAANALLYALSH